MEMHSNQHPAYHRLQPQTGQPIAQQAQPLPLPHHHHIDHGAHQQIPHHSLAAQNGQQQQLDQVLQLSQYHPDLRQQLQQDSNNGGHGGHGYQQIPFEPQHHGGHQLQQQQQQQQVQNGSPHTPHQQLHQQVQHQMQQSNGQQQQGNGYMLNAPPIQHNSIARLQQEEVFAQPHPQTIQQDGGGEVVVGEESNGHKLSGNNLIENPPDLDKWRHRLFDVNDTITLSEEEYDTYFPHVDNVYSHRSTQKYKRKPFVSHYWDCRLKGRPPGTPKSDDPNKKKRKRTARERDLCDVKIKITEYFANPLGHTEFAPDGPHQDPSQANNFFAQQQGGQMQQQTQQYHMNIPLVQHSIAAGNPGAGGAKYYTIQRVNGNGGNGKSDGVAGPHKHSLEDSDKVKKNSVQRWLAKKDKEEKKTQKTYHKKATGSALVTVRKHAKDSELKLFGSCFCPFVQRVWIALEFLNWPYQYIEVDPYKKPQALLDVNPRGLVPGIRHNDWGCGESTVLMEYLDDLAREHRLPQTLLPPNPQIRATSRLWADHINRKIVPLFYSVLQEQLFPKQLENIDKLQEEIRKIVEVAHPHGPFFLGHQISYVDIQFAPWILRFGKVLKHYRHFPDPEPNTRWQLWVEAVENNEYVKNTVSTDDLYIDSYERYSQNRPGTSELADAINGGYSLP